MEPLAIPGEVIAGAFVAAGLGVFGWLLRLALGETLRGLQASLADLRRSIDMLTHRVDGATERLLEHESRLAVAEDRIERMER